MDSMNKRAAAVATGGVLFMAAWFCTAFIDPFYPFYIAGGLAIVAVWFALYMTWDIDLRSPQAKRRAKRSEAQKA